MSEPSGPRRLGVLLNRRAGGPGAVRFWDALRRRLAILGWEAELLAASDATAAVAAVAQTPMDSLLVIGGDGTVHAAVNGLARHPAERRPALAIVGFGTGNDSARQLGLPADPRACADRIAYGRTQTIDLIRVVPARSESGQPGEPELAINSTGWGFVGTVLRQLDRGPVQALRSLSGKLYYLGGTLAGWGVHDHHPVHLVIDGRTYWDGPGYAVIVANGTIFGGGVPIAPDARQDDGLLDVIVVEALDRLRMLRLLPLVYRGQHLGHPRFRHWRGRRIEIDGDGAIDADGEIIGHGSLIAEVLPGALRVCR